MMCPVRKGTTKGVSEGRYADGKSGISWEQKGRGKQGKGKGKKEHDYAPMFYYFLDGHSRSNLHVSLPRTRSYGYTFNLSMEPAIEFMQYDRSDEFLESII